VAQRGTLDRLLLALTWLTVAMGAVVFPEPAPADLLMLVLIVLLPLAGFVRVEPALGGLLGMMLVAGAAALLGATRAFDRARPRPYWDFALPLPCDNRHGRLYRQAAGSARQLGSQRLPLRRHGCGAGG